MKERDLIERYLKCQEELKKVIGDKGITNCDTCPFFREVYLSNESDALTGIKVNPCAMMERIITQIIDASLED